MRNKTVDLMANVNDHRNGMFMGRVEGIEISNDLSEPYIKLTGLSRCIDTGVSLRIAGRAYPYLNSMEWVGNWCWNRYAITLKTAMQLLEHLRRLKSWDMEEATSEIFEAWKENRPITAEMLKG